MNNDKQIVSGYNFEFLFDDCEDPVEVAEIYSQANESLNHAMKEKMTELAERID